MKTIDDDEREVLSAYEKGKLKSIATKGELAKFKAAARATAVKDRINRGHSADDSEREGRVIDTRKGDREIGN